MTWRYEQSTGRLSHDGVYVATGYAGHGAGLNNPAAQAEPDVGPLPRGRYAIGAMRDGGHMGPHVLPLTPDPANQMFGRFAFYIHGDLIDGPPHAASDGCVILALVVRTQIANSGDDRLEVV